jgi:hypothetical protein
VIGSYCISVRSVHNSFSYVLRVDSRFVVSRWCTMPWVSNLVAAGMEFATQHLAIRAVLVRTAYTCRSATLAIILR